MIDALQLVVPVAVVHALASTLTCTVDRPAAGLDAVPVIVKVPTMVAPACGLAIEIEGGVLLTVTRMLAVVVFRRVSVARAAMVWLPFARLLVLRAKVQLEPLRDAGWNLPESTATATELTPYLADAVPETVMLPKTVAPAAGDWMLTETEPEALTGAAPSARAMETASGAQIQRRIATMALIAPL